MYIYSIIHKLLELKNVSLSHPGFTALDATVLAVTEIMWTFVHLNHRLVDTVLKFTIQFLLTPVSLFLSLFVSSSSGVVVGYQNSQMCETALSVVMRMLKPRKKEVDKNAGEKVVSLPFFLSFFLCIYLSLSQLNILCFSKTRCCSQTATLA